MPDVSSEQLKYSIKAAIEYAKEGTPFIRFFKTLGLEINEDIYPYIVADLRENWGVGKEIRERENQDVWQLTKEYTNQLIEHYKKSPDPMAKIKLVRLNAINEILTGEAKDGNGYEKVRRLIEKCRETKGGVMMFFNQSVSSLPEYDDPEGEYDGIGAAFYTKSLSINHLYAIYPVGEAGKRFFTNLQKYKSS